MTPRLKEINKKDIIQNLKSKFGYKNVNMGPKLDKIVINTKSNTFSQGDTMLI